MKGLFFMCIHDRSGYAHFVIFMMLIEQMRLKQFMRIFYSDFYEHCYNDSTI
jgi:hypothetical protein